MGRSYLLNVFLGIIMLITMLFCIGDLNGALSSTAPYQVLFNNTGKTGVALLLNIVVFLLIFSGNITALATSSRELWAFSRDKGFPFSKWISHVSISLPYHGTSVSILILRSLLDELEIQHPFQFRLPNLRSDRHPLPHQPRLHPRVQHHCLTLPPGPAVDVHDFHRLRPSPPSQRPRPPPRALEPGPVRSPDQYVCLLLLRFRPGLLLFPGRCAGYSGHGELGAGCVGGRYCGLVGDLFPLREAALYAAGGFRRREEESGCGVAVDVTKPFFIRLVGYEDCGLCVLSDRTVCTYTT